MRLPNLEGYLKFPGPFPVASIRLKYVARPAAAERFVPRKGDGADRADGAADATEAMEPAVAASADDNAMTIPDAEGARETGQGGAPLPWEDALEPALLQGELELLPLPAEAGGAETDNGAAADDGPKSQGRKPEAGGAAAREDETAAGPALTANGKAPVGDAGTADPATPEPGAAPVDGSPAGPEPQDPPAGGRATDGGDAADPGAGRTPEWI